MSLLLLLGSFFGGEVDRLESPTYEVREAAHARLKSCGLLAVPALRAGLANESPEVRMRCERLLAPWRRLAWNIEAAAVLTAPNPPDPVRFWWNDKLQTHVFRLAIAAGCYCYEFDPFGGGGDTLPFWAMTPEELAMVLDMFRIQLATAESRP